MRLRDVVAAQRRRLARITSSAADVVRVRGIKMYAPMLVWAAVILLVSPLSGPLLYLLAGHDRGRSR